MERNVNDPNGAVEPASSGARQAIDKVTGALRPGVEHLAEDAQHAVDRVADAASRLKQTLQVGGGRLKDAQARFSADRRSASVRSLRSPWPSASESPWAGCCARAEASASARQPGQGHASWAATLEQRPRHGRSR